MSNTIRVTVEFPFDQAWALAQFLKRSCHDQYQEVAVDVDELEEMLAAVRRALAEAGIAPR